MKAISVILLLIFAATTLSIVEEGNSVGWYVPLINGSFEYWSEDDLKDFERNYPISEKNIQVHYYLYTRSNLYNPQFLRIGDTNVLKSSRFNRDHPTRFVIHGWQSFAENDLCYGIRNGLLAVANFNVICVDWSDVAQTINYPAAKRRVPDVGRKVANMIDFLHRDGGMSFGTLHVAGHSLGAHVAGFAGKNVKYGRIHQITGLDPALPLYNYDKPSERLNEYDAAYVESIQTNGGLLGFLKPIGKGAFYPNGGKSQPGCGLDLAGSCSHSRSYEYFAEALRANNFPTMKCFNYESAVNNACGHIYSSVRMGAPTNYMNAKGDFYVPVNARPPYGMGRFEG